MVVVEVSADLRLNITNLSKLFFVRLITLKYRVSENGYRNIPGKASRQSKTHSHFLLFAHTDHHAEHVRRKAQLLRKITRYSVRKCFANRWV
jgi:hypothetical protein